MSQSLDSVGLSLSHNWLGKTDIAVQTILSAIGLTAVGLRLWSRHLERVPLQVNDWLIMGAIVSHHLISLEGSL